MKHEPPAKATFDFDLPWHLASTLTERLSWDSSPGARDEGRGARRVEMWNELKAFGEEGRDLTAWLESAGLTLDDFTALLGETEPSLRDRRGDEPEWHRDFRRWWTATRTDGLQRLTGDLQLLEWARPLLEGAVEELSQTLTARLADQTDPVFQDEHVLDRFLESVPLEEVHSTIQRTAVLELNVFRVEGRLNGDGPDERFADFCRRLSTDETALPLWREYCVLARMVATQLRFWIETRVELFEALAADLDAVRAEIPGASGVKRLESLEFGEGDPHRHGRSVGLVRFDEATVVFKPRPLAMDKAYIGLIEWLNGQGLSHDLRTAETLDRGDHGWVRYLESSQAVDREGARRFAWRAGALAAVLYALHATDFHFENIIACDDHPVLVDLETLLHSDKTDAVVKIEGSADATALALSMSVHSTGLLPNPLLVRDDEGLHALDISGAAGHGGQQTPMPVPTWEGSETDTMRLVKQYMEMDGEDNRPVGEDGDPIDIAGDRDAVAAGFTETYEALQNGADELLADGGLMSAFERLETRHIARATHIYGTVLQESTHPDFLRDGLDRDRSLARLRSGHRDRPERAAMIDSEIAELTVGDVPVFTIDTSTGTLYGGTPAVAVGTREKPLEAVRGRIGGMNEDDRLRQAWIVDASLAATTMVGTEARWPNWSQPVPADPADSADFAAESLAVARRIQRLMIRGEDSMGWLGLDLIDERHWMLAPAPIGLYNGIGGIAHALDAVAAVTGDRSLAEDVTVLHDYIVHRSRQTIEGLEQSELEPSADVTPVGAFNDIVGMIYALSHAAARHGRTDCADAAVDLLTVLEPLIETDRNFDVVSGCAGLIMGLESLEAVAPGRGAAELAVRAADHLVRSRTVFDIGWGWTSPANAGVALNGFSHGTAGIATALARLNSRHYREDYREAVAQALAFEDAGFDHDRGIWTDLRPDNPGGGTVMHAWCHGAPGIGLSRQLLLDTDGHGLDPDALRADRDRAVAALYGSGWDGDPVTGFGNHSLCHGDVGNLLILDAVARAPEIRERLPRLWKAMLVGGAENGWLCGVPHGVESPGLLTGLAGIAWGLARKADPAQVPDLLSLETPDGGGHGRA